MIISRTDCRKETIAQYGDTFVIGNGHLGYRGTLEEYGKSEKVGLNVVGLYDRFKGKWRESVNVPNPFSVQVRTATGPLSVLSVIPSRHRISLDLKSAFFSRTTDFPTATIASERFVSAVSDDLLAYRYRLTAQEDGEFELSCGIDTDIDELNGPHLPQSSLSSQNGLLIYRGVTNEKKQVSVFLKLLTAVEPLKVTVSHGIFNEYRVSLKKGESFTFYGIARVEVTGFPTDFELETFEKYSKADLEAEWKRHQSCSVARYEQAAVHFDGPEAATEGLAYSVYQLLSIAPRHNLTSIPARGLSGQTYKGAIFWDTEIFMLPFYLLTDPEVAQNLIRYRINGLKGARMKARQFGYRGAFYAWESQEEGKEACSLYNVTDALTGKPIRTYFADKQIHISAAVVKAIFDYVEWTGDEKILFQGGLEVALEVARFYESYAVSAPDGTYHLNDVIGPDEYHERVDDNAYTNFIVKETIRRTLRCLWPEDKATAYRVRRILGKIKMTAAEVSCLKTFSERLFVPGPDGLIEQFKGYFELEDVTVTDFKARIENPQEYWGQKAASTRVIKQADVVTLLALFPESFKTETVQLNYDFYKHYTEHGSSLSASMHSLVASRLGKTEEAYEFFLKTARADLGESTKKYAGGIYIGGTHPAANGGAYMSVVFGMAGLRWREGKVTFEPQLPPSVNQINFKYYESGKLMEVTVTKEGTDIREVKP